MQEYTRHSFYCRWDRDRGAYRKDWDCTCGLAELKEHEGEIVRIEDEQETEQA